MIKPFTSHRTAALAVLNTAPLNVREGGFCGQMAFSETMSEKQARWLRILLKKHDLPELVEDAGEAA